MNGHEPSAEEERSEWGDRGQAGATISGADTRLEFEPTVKGTHYIVADALYGTGTYELSVEEVL